VRKDMGDVVAAKANIDRLLSVADGRNKEMER